MRYLTGLIIATCWLLQPVHASETSGCPDTLDFTVSELAGEETVNLCQRYLGKVILIVNTASKCGFTPQYDGLETLYRKYKDDGLVVLGFPSNDFAQQEPGTEHDIKKFCRMTYGVKFPMFAKTSVRQDTADPLYKRLGTLANEFPQWNFHKYVLDRSGKLVASFASRTKPQSPKIVNAIESLL